MQIIRNYTVCALLWWDSCFRTKSDHIKKKQPGLLIHIYKSSPGSHF